MTNRGSTEFISKLNAGTTERLTRFICNPCKKPRNSKPVILTVTLVLVLVNTSRAGFLWEPRTQRDQQIRRSSPNATEYSSNLLEIKILPRVLLLFFTVPLVNFSPAFPAAFSRSVFPFLSPSAFLLRRLTFADLCTYRFFLLLSFRRRDFRGGGLEGSQPLRILDPSCFPWFSTAIPSFPVSRNPRIIRWIRKRLASAWPRYVCLSSVSSCPLVPARPRLRVCTDRCFSFLIPVQLGVKYRKTLIPGFPKFSSGICNPLRPRFLRDSNCFY